MRYSSYIFDFDYTLGDSTGGVVASINHALAGMQLPVRSRDEIRKTIGMSLPNTFIHLTGIRDPEQGKQFSRLFQVKADQIMALSTDLFPDTIRLLTVCKAKGYKTGIVTTKHRYIIEEILEKFHIAGLVDLVIGNEDVRQLKPHPEALLTALRRLNTSGGDSLYVGDSLIDAEAASWAQIDFIAVTTGTTGKDEFAQFRCLKVIGALSELLADLDEGREHPDD